MHVISIQHKNVAKQIQDFGFYSNTSFDRIPSNLRDPYIFMRVHYEWQGLPLFSCPVGHYVNFSGANCRDAVLLQFDIPDEFVRYQDFYSWSDFIYFMEDTIAFHQACPQYADVESFGRFILDEFKDGHLDKTHTYQTTSQLFMKNWLECVQPVTDAFLEEYYDTGGASILRSLI